MWSIQLALTLDLTSVTHRRLNAASLATPADRSARARRDGADSVGRMHLSSSVHTGGFLEGRSPIIENSDYYTQLNQIRGYFHNDSPGVTESRASTKEDSNTQKQSSFGEPLSRIPSVSIFRSLPHFSSSDLPDDHIVGPMPRGGMSTDVMQAGQPFSAHTAPRPSSSAVIPVSAPGVTSIKPDGVLSASSSLGRSCAIPISMGPTAAAHPSKISGSFREENQKNSPMLAMQYSGEVRSPVNPIAWSPAKPGRISPSMSPFRSRDNSEDAMFMMDEEDGESSVGRRRLDSTDSISVSSGRIHWNSGSCNEQGRYKYQEDRCVHYSDVLAELSLRESDGSIGAFEQLSLCPGTLQSSTTTNSTIGYFGVFDGHAGKDGSIYVSQNLHLNIMRYQST